MFWWSTWCIHIGYSCVHTCDTMNAVIWVYIVYYFLHIFHKSVLLSTSTDCTDVYTTKVFAYTGNVQMHIHIHKQKSCIHLRVVTVPLCIYILICIHPDFNALIRKYIDNACLIQGWLLILAHVWHCFQINPCLPALSMHLYKHLSKLLHDVHTHVCEHILCKPGIPLW